MFRGFSEVQKLSFNNKLNNQNCFCLKTFRDFLYVFIENSKNDLYKSERPIINDLEVGKL